MTYPKCGTAKVVKRGFVGHCHKLYLLNVVTPINTACLALYWSLNVLVFVDTGILIEILQVRRSIKVIWKKYKMCHQITTLPHPNTHTTAPSPNGEEKKKSEWPTDSMTGWFFDSIEVSVLPYHKIHCDLWF